MALVSEYDGFIFDYGGVLVHHQTTADQAHLAQIAGIDPERFSEAFWGQRPDYDKGIVTGVEYWQNIAREAAGKVFDLAVIDKLTEADNQTWMRFDQEMWDWIDFLRSSGKRVAMLSNMPQDLGLALRSQTDRLNHFDHVTVSYEVHSIKPEPAIYEHCLEGIATKPERTIFFDDRIVNVQGAEMLGLHAVEFLNRDDVLLKMRA